MQGLRAMVGVLKRSGDFRGHTFDQEVSMGFSERFQHGPHDHGIKECQEFDMHLRAEGVKRREESKAYLRNDFGIVAVQM